MKVLKFGGISLKDAAAIKKLKDILIADNEKKMVVVSAFFGVTDLLADLIETLKNKNFNISMQIAQQIEAACLKIVNDLESCRNSETFIKEQISQIKTLIPALALLGEITNRSVDMFLSVGEKISSFVLADYLNSVGVRAGFVDGCRIIVTDNCHTKAAVNFELTRAAVEKTVVPLFAQSPIVVTAGFIAADPSGVITTLGRGGERLFRIRSFGLPRTGSS